MNSLNTNSHDTSNRPSPTIEPVGLLGIGVTLTAVFAFSATAIFTPSKADIILRVLPISIAIAALTTAVFYLSVLRSTPKRLRTVVLSMLVGGIALPAFVIDERRYGDILTNQHNGRPVFTVNRFAPPLLACMDQQLFVQPHKSDDISIPPNIIPVVINGAPARCVNDLTTITIASKVLTDQQLAKAVGIALLNNADAAHNDSAAIDALVLDNEQLQRSITYARAQARAGWI